MFYWLIELSNTFPSFGAVRLFDQRANNESLMAGLDFPPEKFVGPWPVGRAEVARSDSLPARRQFVNHGEVEVAV